MKQIRHESDLFELTRAASALAVIGAWHQLGVWNVLAAQDKPVTFDEVPGDNRALAITARAMAHLGLVEGDGERWMLSPVGRQLFAEGSLLSANELRYLGDLSRMDGVLGSGGPVLDEHGNPKVTTGGVKPDDIDHTRRFLTMLHDHADKHIGALMPWVLELLPPSSHILDVGGGHGRYAAAFVEAGWHATLFDQAIVVEIARERYGDVLDFLAGDFHGSDFGGGPYDAAFLSNIVHSESDAANGDMFRRLHAAIRPGGLLIVKDMFIDEQGADPVNAVMFGITMLFYTARGASYTLADVGRWCAEAGFGPPRTTSLAMSTLVVAERLP